MVIALLILMPIIAAPALFLLGRRRDGALDNCAAVIAGAELLLSLSLTVWPSGLTVPGILVDGLRLGTDGFRVVYSTITSILWFGTTVFSRQYFLCEREHMGSYWAFVMITLGAAQGVMLSLDFMTTFVFFELLSLSSFPWVAQERTKEAIRAAETYLAVAVIGGLILFMGLLLLQAEAGTLVYRELPEALGGRAGGRVLGAGILILLGFGAKAGMFPLHIWLPKAHPVAPAPASALLSGLLTKVGVFGILMAAGSVFYRDRTFGLVVLALGTVTMVLGAVLALFSVNLKRTLACSSMSQIGFILVGVAAMTLSGSFGAEEGEALASSGLMLHMVNHSLLKLVLFLGAGAVAMNLHTLSLSEVRGWGRNKPVLKLTFGVAALGISGVPLFNGYLSKTLLHEGLVHCAAQAGALAGLLKGVEVLFLGSGGLTFAYMLRLFFCLFVEKNADPVRQARYDGDRTCLSPRSAAVLIGGAALVLAMGVPQAATALAARMTGSALHHFAAFSPENLKGSLISLTVGAAVYLGLARPVIRYRDLWPKKLDLEDLIYRPLLLRGLPGTLGPVARLFGENLILRPLCRFVLLAASVAGRALDTGTDALILISRRSVFREERVRDGSNLTGDSRLKTLANATAEALSQVLDNFSYAMMMACLGIAAILAALALWLR